MILSPEGAQQAPYSGRDTKALASVTRARRAPGCGRDANAITFITTAIHALYDEKRMTALICLLSHRCILTFYWPYEKGMATTSCLVTYRCI